MTYVYLFCAIISLCVHFSVLCLKVIQRFAFLQLVICVDLIFCIGLSLYICMSAELLTRSSAIAEGPRDALCQLKSCQLPHNSAETTCTTSPEEIGVM